jgi:hypothetical protein
VTALNIISIEFSGRVCILEYESLGYFVLSEIWDD